VIGPLPHGQSFLTSINFASSPTLPGVVLKAADGSTAVGHSTAGIINLGGNIRGKLITPPSTDGWYLPEWDDNGGNPQPDEAVWVSTILSSILANSTAGTATLVAATSPASVNPLTFTIKRGDTDPAIQVQALVSDPADVSTLVPWPIPDGATVKFTMRDNNDLNTGSRTTFGGAPKVHATASVDDATNGIMSYGWAAGDTDTDGLFRGEFEVTSGSEVRTFPVGTDAARNWIAITITDDLDPGIDP
jgi:hypothetical protein